MPPSGYLTVSGIESCLQYLASTYSSICQLIALPETSVEGRTSRAIKIANGSGANRRGVLFIGGVHARELVNPDTLASLALRLCQAYTNNTGLTFGGKTYAAGLIQTIVNGLDLFFIPLVNPDGRAYVQSPTGYAMWRKNRRVNAGTSCMGVDLNRNYDFLWRFTIGSTSSNPCSDTYKGPAVFSEPETRNVRHMLNTYPNICCFADVHSYGQLVLYPWGDDNNQTTNPTMNFMNPTFDGLRGVLGDSTYREYIPSGDLNWYVNTGNAVRDAISAVRGRVYTVEQSPDLYATSGVSSDYAYSRNFVDSAKRKVRGYVIETATEFQPDFPEAWNVMNEVSSGLIQFCLSCLCTVEQTVRGTDLTARLDDWRDFRDKDMLKFAAGKRYADLLEQHSAELTTLLMSDAQLRKQTVDVLRRVDTVVRSRHEAKPKIVDAQLMAAVVKLAQTVSQRASSDLKKDIAATLRDQRRFLGKSILDGLKAVGGGAVRGDRGAKAK